MDAQARFNCIACGKCCSKIAGLSAIDSDFLREFGYGKMPITYALEPEKVTFPLWDFESKRFRKYGLELKIDAKILPQKGIMDLKSNKFIILTYQMTSEACPFLFEGKCIIYDKERSFICKLYPFNHSPGLRGAGAETMFGDCRQVDQFRNIDDEKKLGDVFGECFESAIENDKLIERSNSLIIEMMKKEIIKPAINYPTDYLKKRIANSLKVDFFDFVESTGFASKEEIDRITHR